MTRDTQNENRHPELKFESLFNKHMSFPSFPPNIRIGWTQYFLFNERTTKSSLLLEDLQRINKKSIRLSVQGFRFF